MRGGPDVSFGEVWNILASLVVRRRRLRQASSCRSFFLSPSILGNDNVLIVHYPGWRARNRFLGQLPEMATIRSSGRPLRNAPNGIPTLGRLNQAAGAADATCAILRTSWTTQTS